VAALAGAARVERRVPAPLLDPALATQSGLRVREHQLHDLHAGPRRGERALAVLPRGAAGVRHPSGPGCCLRRFADARLVAPFSGARSDRLGSRWLAPLGLSIACVGLLLLSGLTQATSVAYLVLCLIVTGIGQGTLPIAQRARDHGSRAA